MGWISDFAARTPFEIDQVSEAFVKLRAYGMSPTGGLLRTLGDTASAMGKDVMQAVEAIADAVTGENERLKEFGIKARTSGDTITYEYGGGKLATANARDRAEIQRVLAGIMDEQYSGAMADRMKTFSGMMSNLGDQWTRFQLKVMESGPFEVLKGRLRGVLERIDAMSESGELQELADRVGQGFVTAFETFERDVWPVLKDEVWPALKEIGSAVAEILKGANGVAKAIGGWGVALKGLGLLAMGRIVLGGGRKLAGAGSSALELGGDVKDALASERAKRMRRSVGRLASSGLDLAKPGAGLAKSGLGKVAGGLRRFSGDARQSGTPLRPSRHGSPQGAGRGDRRHQPARGRRRRGGRFRRVPGLEALGADQGLLRQAVGGRQGGPSRPPGRSSLRSIGPAWASASWRRSPQESRPPQGCLGRRSRAPSARSRTCCRAPMPGSGRSRG